MTPGHLVLETHTQHPGLVRVTSLAQQPDPEPTGHHASRIHCVAAFDDSEAAVLHLHEALRRRLVDIDARLYRVPVEQGIAALDAVDLRHRMLYLDCDFSSEQRQRIADLTTGYRRRRQRVKQVFDTIGYIAIGILLLSLFVL